MENSLKDRYIYAVVRHLPAEKRAQAEKELEARIAELTQTLNMEAALAQLGSPEEMALTYWEGRTALISGAYYLMYKRVLMWVLPIVAAGLVVLALLGMLVWDGFGISISVGGYFDVGRVFRSVFGIVGTLVNLFAVITVVFAIMDYKKVSMRESAVDLPDLPEVQQRISPASPIAWLIFSVVSTVILLGFPHVFSTRFDGEWVAVFDVDAIRALWFPIILWMLTEVAVEIYRLVERRYTMRLCVSTMIACLVQAVLIIITFGGSGVVNPEFASAMYSFDTDVEILGSLFENVLARPHLIVMVVMLVGVAVEAIEAVVKAIQIGKRG